MPSNKSDNIQKRNMDCRTCAFRGRDKTNPKYRGRANSNFIQMLEIGDDISNCISTVAKDSLVLIKGNNMEQNIRIRKLTSKECFRLMGFDDEDWEKAHYYTEEEVKKLDLRSRKNSKDLPMNQRIERVSSSQLYKQAGNSICTNVLEAIFGQLFEGKENNYKRWDAVELPNINRAAD